MTTTDLWKKTWHLSSKLTYRTGVRHIMLHHQCLNTSRFFHTGKPRAREALHASVATLPRDFIKTFLHAMLTDKHNVMQYSLNEQIKVIVYIMHS